MNVQNRPLQAAIGAVLLILIGIVHPIFSGELYVETDLGNFHVPIRHFYAAQIEAGERFLWFPYMFNGFHLHGEGQASLFHPLQWILYRLVPVAPAFMLEVVRNYLLLALGSYFLLRRFAMPRAACAIGAIAAGFSSFQMLHFMHLNVVAITAHLPWMLLCVDVGLRASRARDRGLACLGLALGTASQLLHGHPQFVWLVLVGEGVFAAAVIGMRGGVGRLPWLGVAQLVGVLLAGVQLLPQWESLGASGRADPTEGFASTLALDPRELVQLVAPYLYRHRVFGDSQPTEYALYAGALFPVLLAWLWLRRAQLGPARRPAAWLAAAAVVFLWLGLGDAALLFRVQSLLPGLDHFRAPARYILLFQAAGAGLLAVGFSDLLNHVRAGEPIAWRRLGVLAIPFGIACGVAVAAPLLAGAGVRGVSGGVAGQLGSPLYRASGPLLVGIATLAVLAAARGRRSALVVIVLLLAADLGAYGLSFMWRMPAMSMQAFVDRAPAPSWALQHRVHFGPPGWTVREIRLSSGYVAMVPERQLPTDVYDPKGVPVERLIPALRISGIGSAFGRPVPNPLPRVRLVAQTRSVGSDLVAQLASTDVNTVALLAEEIALPPGPVGRAQLRVDRPGRIEIETSAPVSRLLVLSESRHAGWRATLDGVPAPIHAVYGDFMGCVVPAGDHLVRFTFEPASVANGWRLSALGAGLLPLLYLGVARPGRLGRRNTV